MPGDCGEVEGKGEHCSMAVLGCDGTLAMGELGPGTTCLGEQKRTLVLEPAQPWISVCNPPGAKP